MNGPFWFNVESYSPKDVWAKFGIGPVVLQKIFKLRQCIFAISYIYALKKRHSSFSQTLIPLTKEYSVRSLVEISLEVLEKM